MTVYDVILGGALSGVITWYIVQSNRKIIERNVHINKKNDLLRELERRALYIWSGVKDKEFNLDLEHSYLLSDNKRIEDIYKELRKGDDNPIPSELKELRRVATKDIEVVVDSPEKLTSEKLSVIRSQIEDLTKTLESIPPK